MCILIQNYEKVIEKNILKLPIKRQPLAKFLNFQTKECLLTTRFIENLDYGRITENILIHI